MSNPVVRGAVDIVQDTADVVQDVAAYHNPFLTSAFSKDLADLGKADIGFAIASVEHNVGLQVAFATEAQADIAAMDAAAEFAHVSGYSDLAHDLNDLSQDYANVMGAVINHPWEIYS
jgi:hypothetical protein